MSENIFHQSTWEATRYQGACIDEGPEMFFRHPAYTDELWDKLKKEAKAFCARCVIRKECLEKGLEFDASPDSPQPSVWGGLDEQERASLLKD